VRSSPAPLFPGFAPSPACGGGLGWGHPAAADPASGPPSARLRPCPPPPPPPPAGGRARGGGPARRARRPRDTRPGGARPPPPPPLAGEGWGGGTRPPPLRPPARRLPACGRAPIPTFPRERGKEQGRGGRRDPDRVTVAFARCPLAPGSAPPRLHSSPDSPPP